MCFHTDLHWHRWPLRCSYSYSSRAKQHALRKVSSLYYYVAFATTPAGFSLSLSAVQRFPQSSFKLILLLVCLYILKSKHWISEIIHFTLYFVSFPQFCLSRKTLLLKKKEMHIKRRSGSVLFFPNQRRTYISYILLQ